MKDAIPSTDILKMNEVCTLLRMSRPTVIEMAETGIIPAFKTGNKKGARWRFSRKAIEKLLQEKKAQ